MAIKSYIFIPYRLRDHNVQSQIKSFFPLNPRGTAVFQRPKKPFLDVDMGAGLHILVSIWVRYMCAKSHIHQSCGGLPKKIFLAKVNNKYKGHFLTIKIAYEKFLDWKSEQWKHALVPLLHVEIFIFEKHQNLDFWWYFKVSSLGSFGQIFLHSQWLRACLNLGWNLQNPITFQLWVQILHATAR
jgi:hypothetical protein